VRLACLKITPSPTIFRRKKKMLFALSLLSSIAQSRVGQWLRFATVQKRGVRH